jgi:hypothetical protein
VNGINQHILRLVQASGRLAGHAESARECICLR